jgi:farnesyl diphosphate synthase
LIDIAVALEASAATVERQLAGLIPEITAGHRRLVEAMRYAALGGGKRLRPFLALESAGLFGADKDRACRVAAAIEMVHCYSLVHDDLPAMDDDDLRRGKPTAHIAFDDATAILAGDALLTLAFDVLSDPATDSDGNVRAALVLALARAAGRDGMVGGQMIDLEAEKRTLDLDAIIELQAMKTGALIAVSCEAGAILGRATGDDKAALAGYAADLGLAFQIADDLLDIEGDVEEVGKGVGKDAAAGKATFVSLLGAGAARSRAEALVSSAIAHLDRFDARADGLRAAARFVVQRRH